MADTAAPQIRIPENVEHFRAFFDSSSWFAWAKDESGRYIYVNATYERLLATRVTGWFRKTDHEIWSPESAERFRKNDLQVIEQQRTLNAVEELTSSDGGRAYLICKFPLKDPSGQLLVGGVGIDISEQKRLEGELRLSEERFRTLSNLATEGIIIHDGKRIIDANAGAPKLLGYTEEEFLQCSAEPFLGPAIETTLPRKDGLTIPVEIETRSISSAGSLWVTVIRDLSERKRREQELRDAEERWRLAQETANFGYFDWDLNSGKTTWSSALRRFMIGELEPSTSLLDRLIWVHPDDRDGYRASIESALVGGMDDIRFSYRSTGPGQATCWRICEARVHRNSDGKPIRIAGVIADITPHKKAEEAHGIEQQRKRLESVIHSMTEPVMIFDSDGRCTSMNAAALRLHRFDSPADLPTNFAELTTMLEATHLDGSALAKDEWPINQAFSGRVVTGMEFNVRNRKTGHSWLASHGAAPILDEAGKVVLAVLSIHDITAERSSAEEIQRANSALHELSAQLLLLQDEERKRIARDLHDGSLQGITAMAMNLLLIARSPAVMADPETQRLIVETQELARNSSRELRTLSYLLHPPDLEEFGLLQALRSWADGFSQRSGIDLDVEMEDPGRLKPEAETAVFRIVQEALANVHRHSGSTTAKLLLSVSEENIFLEIHDDGCGIPSEVMDRYPARMGVGLLGMRERTRQLGGTLQILPNGTGTVVRAVLPRNVRS